MYADPKCDCRMACDTPSGGWRWKTSFSIWGRNASFRASLILAGRRPRTSLCVCVHPARDLRASAVVYSVNWCLLTDVSGQYLSHSQWTISHSTTGYVTSQKSSSMIYIVAEAWNPPAKCRQGQTKSRGTLFNLCARWEWVVKTKSRSPYLRCPFYKWLVGPRADLDGCGKSRPRRDLIQGPSNP